MLISPSHTRLRPHPSVPAAAKSHSASEAPDSVVLSAEASEARPSLISRAPSLGALAGAGVATVAVFAGCSGAGVTALSAGLLAGGAAGGIVGGLAGTIIAGEGDLVLSGVPMIVGAGAGTILVSSLLRPLAEQAPAWLLSGPIPAVAGAALGLVVGLAVRGVKNMIDESEAYEAMRKRPRGAPASP